MSLFDKIPREAHAPPPEFTPRICSYTTKYGSPCTKDAAADSTVCSVHGGGKPLSVDVLQRRIRLVVPLAIETILDKLECGDDELELKAAIALLDRAGIKAGMDKSQAIDPEELESSRRTLGHKLEQIIVSLNRQAEKEAKRA